MNTNDRTRLKRAGFRSVQLDGRETWYVPDAFVKQIETVAAAHLREVERILAAEAKRGRPRKEPSGPRQ